IVLISIILAKNFIFKADIKRTGFQDELIREPFTLIKKIEIPGELNTTPIIKNEKIIFGGFDKNVWLIDLKTGEILSNLPVEESVESPAETTTGIVIFATRNGKIYGLSSRRFEKIWEYNDSGQITSAPLIYDDKLFILTGYPTSRLLVLNPFTGSFLWDLKLGIPAHSSILISSNILVATSSSGEVLAINIETRNMIWKRKFNGSFRNATPVIFNNYIYLIPGELDLTIYKLDLFTGNIVAQSDITPIEFDPYEKRAKVYFTGGVVVSTDKLFAVYGNKDTGYKITSFDFNLNKLYDITSGPISDNDFILTPQICADRLFVPTADGVYVYNTLDGSFITKLEDGQNISGSVAIANGRLVIPLKNGVIAIYEANLYTAISNPGSDYEVVFGTIEVKGYVKGSSWEVYLNDVLKSSGNYNVDTSTTLLYIDTSKLANTVHKITLKANGYESDVFVKVKRGFARSDINIDDVNEITSNDATKVIIPQGALNQEDVITIDDDISIQPNIEGVFKTSKAKKIIFENPTTTILTPITIMMKINDDDLNIGNGEIASKRHLKALINGNLLPTTYENGFLIFTTTMNSNITIVEDRRIPKSGGVYESHSSFMVKFPAGALKEDDYVKVVKTHNDGYNSITPDGFTPAGKAYEIKMGKNNNFEKDVEVLIPVENTVDVEKLRPFVFDENEKIWRPLLKSEVYNGMIKTWTNHFSVFKLFKYNKTNALLTKDKVYTYPNPAYEDYVFFKGYAEDDGTIKIKVFNVAAEKVYEFQFDVKAYNAWEHRWDISKIASGIYIYVVEGVNKKGQKFEVKKKLAIIH
ncbi:MAG: PQQ-binding-like beta-propeller repeat protein, partial [bacterium]|nr:PQQ-binding-like beta-propeller repeat protein [bacterium]